MVAKARIPSTRCPSTDNPANGPEKTTANMQTMATTSQISLRELCETPGAFGAEPPAGGRGGDVETVELIA
jgi:hypothetical protein